MCKKLLASTCFGFSKSYYAFSEEVNLLAERKGMVWQRNGYPFGGRNVRF